MEEYINKKLVLAEEYIESGIQFQNTDMLREGKELFIKIIPLVNQNKELRKLTCDKIVRACTALCLVDSGNSLVYLNEALLYDDKHPVIYNNLGYVYHHQYSNFDKAIESYNKCFEYDNKYIVAYLGIIDIYRSLRHHSLEMEYCKKGIRNCPREPSIWNLYGLSLLNGVGKFDVQVILKVFYHAISLCTTPDHVKDKSKIYVNIGHVQGITGDYSESIRNYLYSLECDARHENAYQNILLNLHYFSNDEINSPIFTKLLKRFGVGVEAEEKESTQICVLISKLHSKICQELYPDATSSGANIESTGRRRDRDVNRKLRIGYISSDFFEHAVSFFSNVLFKYPCVNFETFVYSNIIYDVKNINDLKCHSYKCIKGLSAKVVHDQIKSDEIDILIDLSGHTSGNRLDVLVTKPAEICLTYLGYPNNLGLPFIKRISDVYTEKYSNDKSNVYTLDRLFLSYTPSDKYIFKPKLVKKLEYITFGCFSKLQKINISCIVIWKQLLKTNIGSKLLLKSKYFVDDNVCKKWKDKFSPYQDRVVLLKGTKDTNAHLDMFHLVDIHLDTWGYSGTTISTESLFMNVPVVTYSSVPTDKCKYVGHVERVTGSILTSMGLQSDCVASSKTDYIKKATNLANKMLQGEYLNVRERFFNSEISNHKDFILKYETLLSNIYLNHHSSQ